MSVCSNASVHLEVYSKKKKSRKSEFQIETIQNDKEMLNKGEENK